MPPFVAQHLLTLLIALPLFGALAVALVPAERRTALRWTAFFGSLAIFIFSLLLIKGFNPAEVNIQFAEKIPWIPTLDIKWFVGIDGISLVLILLTTFLFPVIMVASKGAVAQGLKTYLIAMFLLETAVIGCFAALDLVLFYIFFEMILIPMTLLIIVWGGSNRLYAGIKFFIFTMAGSVFMLFSVLALPWLHYKATGIFTTDLLRLYAFDVTSFGWQVALFLGFSLAFAIKIPMFPFHTWLPDAHTEAPTGGSVILAGILLKVGAYGFLRFAIPLFPQAVAYFATTFLALGVFGIIYGAVVAMVQPDMKRLVAYSSVSHMGYIVVGMFALNSTGVTGSVVQMINHGLSTGALFLLVGVLYERRHTRMIADYGGIAAVMPRYAFIFMLVMLSSVALPGLNGFVGEFLILVGAFQSSKLIGVLATSGAILGAAYMLWLYERVFYGGVAHKENQDLADLGLRETLQFVPMLALCFIIGIFPSFATRPIQASVDYLVANRANYTLQIAGATDPAVTNALGLNQEILPGVSRHDPLKMETIRQARFSMLDAQSSLPEQEVR